MIIDGRNGLPTGWDSPDVCIVGGGAAGLAMALSFARQGQRRVLVLEMGDEHYRADVQNGYGGRQTGDRHAPLIRARYAGLGGSTHIWAGWCRPMDAYDFSERPWLGMPGWPLMHESLKPWYSRASEVCGLSSDTFGLASVVGDFPGTPLLADQRGPEGPLCHPVFHMRRFDFAHAYRQTLAESPTVLIALNVTALRVVESHSQSGVMALDAFLGGRSQLISPGNLVLAAGGLENPRLLLLSRLRNGDIPGNQGHAVGRYFTEHGFADPGWFIPADPRRDMRFYFPANPPAKGRAARFMTGSVRRPVLSLSEAHLRNEQLLNAILYFYPAYECHEDFSHPAVHSALELWEVVKGRAVPAALGADIRRALSAPHRVLHALWRQRFVSGPQARWRLRVYFECVPHPDNRIVLDTDKDAWGRPRTHLHWRLQEADLDSIHRYCLSLDSLLRKNGEGHLVLPESPEAWRNITECGKHPMGATRMASSAEEGVVDSDCRVFGTRNLYVAGSSVFPTVGYANPTLTLVALSLRLADHLLNTH